MRLLYASAAGPDAPSGWGSFGPGNWHHHHGTWKGGALDGARLIERAERHTAAGRHEQAANLFLRALLHGASGWSSELVLDVDQRRQRCYHQLGRLAEAHLAIALEYVKQGEAVSAEMYLERAAGQARQDGQPDVLAEVHFARWRLIGAAQRERADEELRRAMEMQPASSRYQLEFALSQLTKEAVHAAQVLPQLARGLELELREGGGQAAPAGAVAAPRTRASLLFLWNVAAVLQSTILTTPGLREQMSAMLQPLNSVASTPCDLEPEGAELTASEVGQEAPGVARASRPTSVLISDRLRVNKYGVAVPV